MNIAPYASYFHDGSIIDIQYAEDELLIFMESAEISPDDLSGDIALSKENALKGILHVRSIQSIGINEQPFNGTLHMLADLADIIRFSITENKIHLFVEWINFPPHDPFNALFSDIIIEAEKINWENILDLPGGF